MLQEADTRRSLINRIHKHQATFFGHVMRREKVENLLTIGMIEEKHSKRKQCEKILDGLTKWLKVARVTEALKAMRDRDVWKVMISFAEEHGT